MEKCLNWEELFILAGFQFKRISSRQFDTAQESIVNIEFLEKIFKTGDICFKKGLSSIEMLSENPIFEEWVKVLYAIGGNGIESGPIRFMQLENVDIPMLAIVRQLNRLGLETVGSCSGHENDKNYFNKKWAYVEFKNPSTALLASKLFNGLDYDARLWKKQNVRINEDHSRLFGLGLELSKVPNLEEIKFQIHQKRESVLEELLMIPGETYHEEIIQARLLTVLPELLDKVWKDDYGNILGIKKCGFGPTIMLSAHMDIKSEICKDSFLNKNGNIWRRSEGILGADDRAGIAMIINILKSICTLNFKGKLKIVFTVEEEEGQQGAENLDPDFYKNVDFAISLDRKNGSNIVTKSSSQQYCDEEYGRVFEKAASLLWDGMYPYKMVTGGISDLRVWSKEGIQSVNLSIGFYDEHMPGETLKIDEWHNTFELVSYVLGMLTTKYRQEKIFIPNIR